MGYNLWVLLVLYFLFKDFLLFWGLLLSYLGIAGNLFLQSRDYLLLFYLYRVTVRLCGFLIWLLHWNSLLIIFGLYRLQLSFFVLAFLLLLTRMASLLFLLFGMEDRGLRIGRVFFEHSLIAIAHQEESIAILIILQLIEEDLNLPIAVFLDKEGSLIPRNINNFQIALIESIGSNPESPNNELNLNEHSMSIYLPYQTNPNVLHLIMEVFQTMMSTLLISILELTTLGKIELVILHFLHHFFLVLPIRLNLLQVNSRFLTFYPLQNLLILQANCLLLSPSIGHVETLVAPRPLLPLLHQGLRLLLADAVYLIEQQLVIVADLAIPLLPHAHAPAMVDENGIAVLHQPGSQGLDVPQVEEVMGISDLDFLQLDQPIEVGDWSIHG